jgi:hypothetical protein
LAGGHHELVKAKFHGLIIRVIGGKTGGTTDN